MRAYDGFGWTSPADLEDRAWCATPWRYYLETKVHFTASGVSGTVWPAADGPGEAPPLGNLHVLTAVQPDADPTDDDSIARLDVQDRELRAAGLTAIRAVGCSFDDSHREESRAVFGLDDECARALGRRFGQVAVFAWSGPRWSLLACAADRQDHRRWRWQDDER